uniref:Keratinocyte associated protein 3 n=1 Tax=Strigops habroptila TaxID=2489341 RepID=A0A672V0B8_STRHB
RECCLFPPRRLMRAGLGLIVLGHGGLALGAIVHGSVLRHVAGTSRAVTPAYAVANVVSVVSGLLVRAPRSHLFFCCLQHWALLSVSLLNCLLSTACSVGLAVAIALTVHSRGMHLITGCNSSALPADARAAIATNDCPFNTTRIYDTALALWFPSMVLAAAEAVLSGRCCVVALVFRGIGPCARSYTKEQVCTIRMDGCNRQGPGGPAAEQAGSACCTCAQADQGMEDEESLCCEPLLFP